MKTGSSFFAPATGVVHAHLLFQQDLGDLDFYLYNSALNTNRQFHFHDGQ